MGADELFQVRERADAQTEVEIRHERLREPRKLRPILDLRREGSSQFFIGADRSALKKFPDFTGQVLPDAFDLFQTLSLRDGDHIFLQRQ